MEKFWLSQYQPGVPTEIDPSTYTSLPELFDESFSEHAKKVAFSNLGTTLSFEQLNILSLNFAAYLQQIGLKKGDKVAIMMPNCLQYPIAIFAILRAGFVVVNVNPLYTASELVHQANDSETAAIIVLASFVHIVKKAEPEFTSLKHIIVTELGDCFPIVKKIAVNLALKYIHKMVPDYSDMNFVRFNSALTIGASTTFKKPSLSHTDIAFIQYTGGTTGVSAGAVLTHKNLIANILQTTAWISPLQKNKKHIIVTALPLYHIFSLTANCFTFLRIGAENLLITNPRDTKAFINQIKSAKFTVITGVNTLFESLLKHPNFHKIDFSNLKLTLSGGMALQKNVASLWQKATNHPILEAYGLTETSPGVCINPISTKKYNGSVGLPIPSTNVSIRDEKGHELPTGEVGELNVSGPQVMPEYWNKPAETKLVFWPDGFLKTGDSARIDEHGYVYLVDRIKDLIIISGFNVYPHQIEEVILQLPSVDEAAVIGIRNQKGQEVVKACVVKKDQSLTAEDIIEHCQINLTAYKIPKIVEFYDELPKSNIGKILKRALK
jgi:long-chain acyl-CoA synthetase